MIKITSKGIFRRAVTLSSKLPTFRFRPRSISTNFSAVLQSALPSNGRASSLQYIQQQIENETQLELNPDVKINYVQVGIGDEPVLCLPGVLGTISGDFRPILQTMDYTRFRFIAMDPPGCGGSRPPITRDFGRDYLRRDAHLAASLMKNLGHEKYSVLGHSEGGTTALGLAMDYPQNVSRVVTWGAFSYLDPRMVIYAQNLVKLETWSKRQREYALSLYGEEELRERIRKYLETTVERVEKNVYHFSDAELKEKIRCPVLFIHGEQDTISNVSHAYHLLKLLPKSCTTSHFFPDAGHLLHLTHTLEFMDIVQSFLNSPIQ